MPEFPVAKIPHPQRVTGIGCWNDPDEHVSLWLCYNITGKNDEALYPSWVSYCGVPRHQCWSHPFYTGKLRTVASEGNVARFTQRFGRFVSTKKGAWWKFLTLCVPQKNAIQTVRLWSEKDGYMWFVNLIHVLRPFRVVRKNVDSKFDGLTIFVWLIIRSD